MEEHRRHAILFAATLLCARRLIESIDSEKPYLAKQYFMDKAIQEAEFILKRIGKRWPDGGSLQPAKGHCTQELGRSIACWGGQKYSIGLPGS